MKMYLISDNVDTYTGMRLAGVDGVVVHERNELKQALEKVLSDPTVGIVLLTEKFLTATEPVVRKTLSPLISLRRSD